MATTPQTVLDSEGDTSSSFNNPNSLEVEKGTTVEEDFFDESSIEALNWSEADEEELKTQEKVKTLSPVTKRKIVKNEESVEGELAAALLENSSDSDTMRLSDSLLQSISSDVGSDSLTANQKIQNWASEVKDAVDRGEISIQDEDEEDEKENKKPAVSSGVRKRKRTEEMAASLSSEDPLSNEPVLDDGPIWDKGPKRYRHAENQNLSKKLTCGVLFAVVLGIGLGIGNFLAYSECETEYKASLQKEQVKPDSMKVGRLSDKEEMPHLNKEELSQTAYTTPTPLETTSAPEESGSGKLDIEEDREKYIMQIETLSKIVQTLDNLQMKIDKFENKSRQLGGVILLKEEESAKGNEEPSPLIEEVHPDIPPENESDPETNLATEEEEQEDEDAFVFGLIDGIEETPEYLRRQEGRRRMEYLDRLPRKPTSYFYDPKAPKKVHTKKQNDDFRAIEAAAIVVKRAHEEFVELMRDELREKKILGLAEERLPEEYTKEERMEIKKKYDEFMLAYPMTREVDIQKERIKFRETGEQQPEENDLDIDGFFNRYSQNQEDKTVDDLDFSDFLLEKKEDSVINENSDSIATKADDIPSDDYPVEIEQDTVIIDPDTTTASTQSDIPVQHSDEKVRGKKLKKSKSKSSKKSEKRKNSQENGKQNGKSNQNGNGKRGKTKDDGKQYGKKKRNENNPNNYPDHGKDSWIGLDDDDDDERKRRFSKSGEDSHNSYGSYPNVGKRKVQEEANWLLERTKVREEIRKDFGTKTKSQQNQHSSSGKKPKNWQMERDKAREKVRDKKKGHRIYE